MGAHWQKAAHSHYIFLIHIFIGKVCMWQCDDRLNTLTHYTVTVQDIDLHSHTHTHLKVKCTNLLWQTLLDHPGTFEVSCKRLVKNSAHDIIPHTHRTGCSTWKSTVLNTSISSQTKIKLSSSIKLEVCYSAKKRHETERKACSKGQRKKSGNQKYSAGALTI